MNRAGDHGLRRTLRAEGLSLDETFGVLADHHRRIVVASLLGSDNSVPVDALIADVMAHADVSTDDPADVRTRIAMRLKHVHLPKLADADLVEWDREHEVVTPTEHLPALAPFVGNITLDQFYR